MRRKAAELWIGAGAFFIARLPAAWAAADLNDPALRHVPRAPVAAARSAAIEPAAGAAAATAETAKAGLPQFDPSSFPGQVFWLIVAFAILYTVFSKFTLPKIALTLQRRKAHIDHDLAAAQTMRANAEMARERFESVMGEAQVKATELYKAAEAEVRAELAAGIEEFKALAATRLQSAEQEIEIAKKAAMESVQVAAAEIAALAAQKIVGVPADMDQARHVVRNLHVKPGSKAA